MHGTAVPANGPQQVTCTSLTMAFPGPRPSFDPAHNQRAQLTGWHLVDTMKALDDKLQLTLGLHGHKVKKVMKDNSHQDSDAICPTFAVSYKVSDNVTGLFYHTESFSLAVAWYLLAEVMQRRRNA